MAVVEYKKQGHIVIITMNRPERHNAMSEELLLGLAESWQQFAADDDAHIAILTGTGKSFCAGMDIKERLASGKPGLGLPQIPGLPRHQHYSDANSRTTRAGQRHNDLHYADPYGCANPC